jgi:hypothetical protein
MQDKVDKVKEMSQRIEQGVKDVFDSDKYKQYLNVMAKFHNYSFRNTMLIMLQRPEATRVAGFNAWQQNFKRTVNKGEKGIVVLAPTQYKETIEVNVIDEATGKPKIDEHGNIEKTKQEIKRLSFMPVYVFDVAQTSGEPIPTLIDELKGNIINFNDFFDSLKLVSPYPIQFEELPEGTKGLCNYKTEKILIKPDMSEVQTIKTAIHEITHAKLHSGKDDTKDRHTREVEAESVACVVCNYYGVDTSDYSFGYIASWSQDKELAELKSSLNTIQSTAMELIDNIDTKYRELTATQEQQIDNIQKPSMQERFKVAQEKAAVHNKSLPQKETVKKEKVQER